MIKNRGKSPMDYALGYLTKRDRTEYEMREYLEQMQFGEADVDLCIDRLIELNLINDAAYADRFVKTRLASKPLSKAHLKRQLAEHHIAAEHMQSALEEIDPDTDETNARQIAEKFYRQFASLDAEKRKQRVLNRLLSRGFQTELCYRVYREIDGRYEEETE